MTDLKLNGDFDVTLDDRNDLATVDGREDFEQSVAVKLTAFMYEIPGESDIDILRQKIRLEVSRVARRHNQLDSIERIVVERDKDTPNTILVELLYSSDDSFDINLNL